MSTDRVQQFLDSRPGNLQVMIVGADTSTVDSAARALDVSPAQIVKTLAVRAGDAMFLLVTSGNARVDNSTFRRRFGAKPRMLAAAEAQQLTGQPIGGIGPFGHDRPVPVYCDRSIA